MKKRTDSLKPDEVLEKIGSFGRYQISVLAVMGFMKMFRDGFQNMITTFLAAEPPWKCAANSSSCNITGSILPGEELYNVRCGLPRSEWEFDTSEFSSIVSEWDLVCDRSSLSSISKSIIYLGFLIGALFGGVLSDKVGRKPITYFFSVLCNLLALIASFVNAFWIFALLRGLIGICMGCSTVCTYILLMEFVGVKHRAFAGVALSMFWSISLMLLALLGYLFRDWRTLSIAGAVPGLLQVFFWWFLEESPRWLLVTGRSNKATAIFYKAAVCNHKQMPENPVEVFEEKRVGDVRDLFRSWRNTYITLTSWLSWAVTSLVFYGANFSAGKFGLNQYLDFFLSALVEIPSHLTAIALMDKKGRKAAMLVGLAFSSIASVTSVLLQEYTSHAASLVGRTAMALIAKFFITITFNAVYVFTAELFPTVVRTAAMGTSSAAGRIGSIGAPFIVWLVRIHVLLPYSIFAGAAFLASLLCLTLPETRNEPTKETFETEKLHETSL